MRDIATSTSAANVTLQMSMFAHCGKPEFWKPNVTSQTSTRSHTLETRCASHCKEHQSGKRDIADESVFPLREPGVSEAERDIADEQTFTDFGNPACMIL